MRHQQRYHIQRQGGRTTLGVDNILSELLALKLGHRPDTPAAKTAVRHWLQHTFEAHLQITQPVRQDATQAMRRYLILALVDKDLSEAWWNWQLGEDEQDHLDKILSDSQESTVPRAGALDSTRARR